jgi:hypothetical protein
MQTHIAKVVVGSQRRAYRRAHRTNVVPLAQAYCRGLEEGIFLESKVPLHKSLYRGTSLRSNRPPLGPY